MASVEARAALQIATWTSKNKQMVLIVIEPTSRSDEGCIRHWTAQEQQRAAGTCVRSSMRVNELVIDAEPTMT